MLGAAAVLVAAALTTQPIRALDPHKTITQYVQTDWNSELGLPENSVHSLAQTRDGYVWVGTEEGLTRFDGVRFVTYTYHNSEGLASNFISALAADRDGTLWVGTDSGLVHFVPSATEPRGGRFAALTTRDGLSDNNITALCEDDSGALWVGTSEGLNRIVKGRVENWTTGHDLADGTVNALAVDAGGTLWVGTSNGTSHLAGDRFITLTQRDGLPENDIIALAGTRDGSMWAGTFAHGIAQIVQGRVNRSAPQLPWKEIAGLLGDRDGALWIGFQHHGLGRLYGGKLELYGTSRGMPSDLCSSAMLQDREGSVWTGTQDTGVVQLRDGWFTVYGKPEGLSGNYVGEVSQGPDGSMWVGASYNGVDRLYPDGRVEILDKSKGLPDQAVFSLLVDRDGSLWIGFQRGTLAHLDRGDVSVYEDPEAPNASLNSLFQDREGRIWVGFNPKGLAQFDHGTFRHITETGIVRYITQTSDGALWLATDGDGIGRLFDGVMTRYTTANGLPSDHVMVVYADGDGSLWAGVAAGGLSRIRDGQVVSWTPEQGAPDTTIGSIIEDGQGNLWIGGDGGIYHIGKAELNRALGVPGAKAEAVSYGQADGLRMAETVFGSMPSSWKARDGRLWFATIAGAAVADPAHIPAGEISPQVLIEQATFNSTRLPLDNGLRIGPGPGNLAVSFTAPSFIAPQQMRFRYRLEGFDADWVAADSRSARYTNLPPGSYTFMVEARNVNGAWNTAGASFAFVLRAPLRESPLAFVCYGLAILALAWAVIALRTRSLLRRQWELTRVVAERTAQLEAEKAALEAARQELHVQATHDSLTGLFNRAAILEHLEREVSRAVRDGEPLGVILADLDNFKGVNDNFGHLCGDDILRETAVRLRTAARDYDLVGRYGGEEFLIIFPGWDLQVAPARIEDLLNAIRTRNFEVAGGQVHLTCSFGVATFRPDVDTPDMWEVLSRADTALYVAKNSGRNTASFEVRPA